MVGETERRASSTSRRFGSISRRPRRASVWGRVGARARAGVYLLACKSFLCWGTPLDDNRRHK